jgi:uncharacterized protein YqjF (DUF2071 family)
MNPHGWSINVSMSLRRVLYVSYLLPVPRMRPLVPDVLPLAVVDSDRVFLSAVLLKCQNVRMSHLPAVRFSYNQVNLRTYVIHPETGQPGVYFLRSGVTSRTISLVTLVFGLRWEKVELAVDSAGTTPSYGGSYRASGQWQGDLCISAEASPAGSEHLDPFTDLEAAANYLVRPTIGFYGSSGRVRQFNIAHGHLEPARMGLAEIRFPLLADSGLLQPEEWTKPHNVLSINESQFLVFLPSRRV